MSPRPQCVRRTPWPLFPLRLPTSPRQTSTDRHLAMPPPLASTVRITSNREIFTLNLYLQTTLKRIHREIADLKKEDLGNMTLGPANDNLFQWKATIPGPEGSVYEGGVFNVDITLGHDYPYVSACASSSAPRTYPFPP